MKVPFEGDSSKSKERFEEEYAKCLEGPDKYFPRHLRCQPNGNFDSAQCIEQTTFDKHLPAYLEENCFCYYEGERFNSSIALLSTAEIVLSCHREGRADPQRVDLGGGHYSGYYRPCEKKHVELRKLKEKFLAEGKTYISTEWLPVCGPDGYHALVQPFKSDPKKGYCSDLLGNQLEDFTGVYAEMDCHCAQVRHRMSGWGEKPHCTKDGSYSMRQCKEGKCYCVDKFGQQCAIEHSESTMGCCISVDESCCFGNARDMKAFDHCISDCKLPLITTTTTTTTTTTPNTATGGPTDDPDRCGAYCVGKTPGYYADKCCTNDQKICNCKGAEGGESFSCPKGMIFCNGDNRSHYVPPTGQPCMDNSLP